VLRKCVVQGGVYQIVHDLFYHRDCARELARILKGLVDEHGAVEAADFRDAVGVGRKRAIQIWSSSTALAILGAHAMRGCCVSTAVGTGRIELTDATASSANSEGMRIRGAAGLQTGGGRQPFPGSSTPATFRQAAAS